jgi:hypothetical protein
VRCIRSSGRCWSAIQAPLPAHDDNDEKNPTVFLETEKTQEQEEEQDQEQEKEKEKEKE